MTFRLQVYNSSGGLISSGESPSTASAYAEARALIRKHKEIERILLLQDGFGVIRVFERYGMGWKRGSVVREKKC